MKTTVYILLLLAGLTITGISKYSNNGSDNKPLYHQRRDLFNLPPTGIKAAIERYNRLRMNVITGKVEDVDLIRSQEEVMRFIKRQKEQKDASSIGLSWIEMGPNDVGGRTRAVLIDKDNHNRMYAGQVSGGLWISDNAGLSWRKWEPSGGLAFMNVSCIAQGPTGHIYVGTGERVSNWGDPGGTESSNTMFAGSGIWKSSDGGSTFYQLESAKPTSNSVDVEWESIMGIACHPTDPNKIFAGTNRGLRVSYDGGATWVNPLKNIACSSESGIVSDVKVTSEGLIFAGFGSTPYYSPDGDTAISIVSVTDNGGYAQLNFASTHKFTAGQRIFVCGGGSIPTPNLNRQIVQSVPSPTSVVLESYFSGDGTGMASSWIKLTSSTDNYYAMDISGSGRATFNTNIADPAYIYCVLSNGTTGGTNYVYFTSDRGKTWTDLGQNLDLGDQAWYDLCIGGYPDKPGEVIVGVVWMASNEFGAWDFHSVIFNSVPGGILYMHADKHAIVVHPDFATNQKIFYGTDGGVFMSQRIGGITYFQEMNRFYATTQMYGLAIGPKGEVFGGTQDNGNPFVDPNVVSYGEPTPQSEDYNLPSGDGGYGEISVLNPDAFIWESQYGEAGRSPVRGTDGGSGFLTCSQLSAGAFVTPFLLWESFYDTTSTEYVEYITDSFEIHPAGDTWAVDNKNRVFSYTTDTPVGALDTLLIQNIAQSRFYIILGNGVWMTKDILDFSVTPNMQRISTTGTTGEGQLAASTDGDKLFFSVGSTLYRIKGISGITISPLLSGNCELNVPAGVTQDPIESFPLIITHISIDPNDANNIVVGLGEYGYNNHVYRCTNGLAAGNSPSFTSIQGSGSDSLPAMPVYSVLIEKDDKNIVIVGTEYGMFATQNAFEADPSKVRWYAENNGMSMVPVYQIRQMVYPQYVPSVGYTGVMNQGVIYIATHGRGMFRCEYYKDPLLVKEINPAKKPARLMVFPNPVKDFATVSFNLDEKASVRISLYDISGKMIKVLNDGNMTYGRHLISLDATGLKPGNYFVSVTANGKTSAEKVVVIK